MKGDQAVAPRTVSPEEVARLRSLGYVAGSATAPAHYTAADDPKSLVGVDAKMHAAIDAFERHNPARGLQLAREFVAERPAMLAGRELLAFMLQQNDLVAQAIEELKTILADPRSSDDDRVQLALLYCETGQAGTAVDVLAPLAGSKNPDVLNAYGVALSDQGKGPQAREQFERVLALDANNAPALQNLGILSLRQDDVNAALSYLNRALDLNPRLPLALNTLGVAYARMNDFGNAVNAWNRALQIDPRQYDALLNIGIIEAKSENKAEAREALQRFIQTAPKTQYAADIAQAQSILAQLH
jgi:Tfp pilus assembly protein PilF